MCFRIFYRAYNSYKSKAQTYYLLMSVSLLIGILSLKTIPVRLDFYFDYFELELDIEL